MHNKDTLCEILSGSPKAAAKIHGSDSYPDICGRAAFYSFGNAVLVRAEIVGKAVIIHKNPDDFMTQPSGNSGEKIACGIIAEL